jgi:hypothetical protein
VVEFGVEAVDNDWDGGWSPIDYSMYIMDLIEANPNCDTPVHPDFGEMTEDELHKWTRCRRVLLQDIIAVNLPTQDGKPDSNAQNAQYNVKNAHNAFYGMVLAMADGNYEKSNTLMNGYLENWDKFVDNMIAIGD